MRIKQWLAFTSIVCVVTGLAACEAMLPPPPNDDTVLDGPLDGLSGPEARMFTKGDAAFNDQVFTSETGLGPYFVATSCGSCHAGDGKGHLFTTLTRFGQVDETGNLFLNQGGPQLQNRALPGFLPEKIPTGATFASFTPPAVTGLGFIEAVPDSVILAMADPYDADADGISGIPNWIVLPSFVTPSPSAVTRSGKYLSRFGKKASVYNLLQQSVTAYNQDMGVTSAFLPSNPLNPLDGAFPVPSTTPEVSDETINAVLLYLQTLKAPVQRDQQDDQVRYGKQLFTQIGCAGCHRPTLRTGSSPIEALSNKEFHPYTDLLLHDMGIGLDDGYTEGSATTSEWRTPPLWGLGLSPSSQGGQYFLMHDGRARSIEQAIHMHGGEAINSRTQFLDLAESDRQAVVRFLQSL